MLMSQIKLTPNVRILEIKVFQNFVKENLIEHF